MDEPITILERAKDDLWGVDESEPPARTWASPLGQFVSSFVAHTGARGMHRLALFVARRALPCWELYCDGTQPIDTVNAAEHWLQASSSALARRFSTPAVPSFRGIPIRDCRECDTALAAAAAAHLARLIGTNDPLQLVLCIDAADGAFNESPLHRHDAFRRWLIEVAVPTALEGRQLTSEERERFRTYTHSDIVREREEQAT